MTWTSLFDHFGLTAFFTIVLVVAALGAYKLVKEWFPW